MAEATSGDVLVAEAVGPALTARQAAAATALGVISLLMAGVIASVLGALADEHRLSAAGIGQCATLEALVMGITTGVAAAWLPAERLRIIGVVSSVVLGFLDIATMGAHSGAILITRTFAGVPEGILLWITIGMIARTQIPARWAGVFLTALTTSQLVLAVIYVWLIPHYGADGAFAALAVTAFAGTAVSLWAPDRYAPLPVAEGESGVPPLRGWIALFASLLVMAAVGAVGVYLQPLAHQAGLDADTARTAVWVSLAVQVVGGSVATLLAHRIHYFSAFVVATMGFVAGWIVFDFHVPGWFFVTANSCAGFMTLFIGPFLVPMTIEADPTRRAAMQSAGAQVLGGALGPLFASFVVGNRDVHGAVFLGIATVITAMVIVTGLHVHTLRERVRLAAT